MISNSSKFGVAMKRETRIKVNRREFLGISWVLSLFALFAQAGYALLQFIQPRFQPGSFGDRIIAGQEEEFEHGTVSHIQKGRFYISRLEDGSMLALWHRCTHLGCTVPWKEDEGVFHCPCHSSIFNKQGEVVSGPAPRPLDLFPIEIVDGQVIVDTGTTVVRSEFSPSQATIT
jgi:cytochrome b6-f complex iron-sulfur subunit